ncbi:hypothetical protein FVEG_04307 [Fusarium verticillioides 7600]|uniref:BZIP domain-containing protein n=1 Tax=Gibberella moniliformis (strain M3125 / FGSC 7600) TaxID=334819 RepID=W7M4P1_GIBM7|nr:hypothetical protein FVEG_04307 [Fusarium verticillioides 7600]EWG42530.1 hypothetical protein FVEG_04307 [Fusarium verticillioides 7600]
MPANTPATCRQARSPTVDSQRLKKRESDRKAQRVSRERTKSRIAYLEDLVQKLSSGDDHDKTLSLMAQLSEVTKQRDSLVRFLDSTSLSFTRHLSEAKKWESSTASQEKPQEKQPSVSGSVSRESPALLPDLLETPPAGNELNLFSPEFTGILPGDMALEGGQACMNLGSATYSASHSHAADEKTSAVSSSCDCTSSETRRLSDGSVVSRNIWQAGNQVLEGPPGHLSTSMLNLEYEASEDVPVRVVLYGWDHLEKSGRMTPLWRRIRHLDEICFSACGQVERLAVIHMVHRYMRAYADPTSANISTIIPRWYMKSTSSQDISGHPAVDYFAWPSFRQQFSRYPHRYCSNLFWHMFKEHLRITWPYEFRDVYSLNVGLGRYGLTSLFRDTISNLGCWTMHSDFFHHFPALIHDVPKSPQTSLPVTVHPWPLQTNSLGYLSRIRTPSHHHSRFTEGTISDPSQGGEDDQGWSYDSTVGEYNWDLDNI